MSKLRQGENKKRYDLILFDLDGTLTDSGVGITRSVQYALAKFGLSEQPENLRSFIGPPLLDSFIAHCGFDDARARQAVDYFREYYTRRGIYENMVYPGISELLETLRGDGRILALATSKATRFAREVLRHFGLDHFFTQVAGSNLDGTGVLKSELIRCVLERLGRPERLPVMVGDRKYDLLGARECAIDSIAVTYGYGSVEELTGAGPTYIAHSVEALEKILFM